MSHTNTYAIRALCIACSIASFVVAIETTESQGSEVAVGRVLQAYSNPNDKYVPTSNVKAGHRISGLDFDTTEEYGTAVLMTPVALFVCGVLSLLLLNVFLCCRHCFKCLRCEPNDHHTDKGHDHDSVAQRITYVNHQKFMIFLIEMVLCGCVMLADLFCFYGQNYIAEGGNDLNKALDDMAVIINAGATGSAAIGGTLVPLMKGSINTAKTTSCKDACADPACASNGDIDTAYDKMTAALTLAGDAMVTMNEQLTPMIDQIDEAKKYVNDYLIKYSDVFVYLVFSFAFVSVCLFVLFRVCRSEIGTKFAMLWGMLTFLILLLVCLPFMIFSSMVGDLCMDPSRNIVMQSPDSVKASVQFYATCVGVDTVGDSIQTGIDETQIMLDEIPAVSSYCTASSQSNTDIVALGARGAAVIQNLQTIKAAAGCTKVQSIWFTIVNDALCTNFYSGIYSLWVSQFITSFFLFFLIVIASISYHYFAESKVYITPNNDEQNARNEAAAKNPKSFAEYQDANNSEQFGDLELAKTVAENESGGVNEEY